MYLSMILYSLYTHCCMYSYTGVYTPEPLSDFSWDVLALGILFLYHWSFMQPLSLVSCQNFENIAYCVVSSFKAILNPFRAQNSGY